MLRQEQKSLYAMSIETGPAATVYHIQIYCQVWLYSLATSPDYSGFFIFKPHYMKQQTSTPTQTLPFSNIPWELLSDTQKAQFLLSTTRLLDCEVFTNEFKSFEYPDRLNETTIPTTTTNPITTQK
jgi:hypothetical protein